MKKLFLNFAYIVMSMAIFSTFIACEDKDKEPDMMEEGKESEEEALQNLYRAVNDYVNYTKEFSDTNYAYRWEMSVTVSQQLSKKYPNKTFDYGVIYGQDNFDYYDLFKNFTEDYYYDNIFNLTERTNGTSTIYDVSCGVFDSNSEIGASYYLVLITYNNLTAKIEAGETLTDSELGLYNSCQEYFKKCLKEDGFLSYIQPCVMVDNSLLLTIDNNRSWIKEGDNLKEIIIIK